MKLDTPVHTRHSGGGCALPRIPLALVGAYIHFLGEERFNHNLLFDLVARPARGEVAA